MPPKDVKKICTGYLKVDPIDFENETTTRRCLVCDDLESPLASIVNEQTTWLCPKCKGVLGFLVEEVITGGRDD